MSDEFERTLCQIAQVFVFKIPPRKSSEGHRAADWPKEPSWTGKLKVVGKGSTLAIVLQDDKNNVFAICQVNDDSAVERTLDSGRYFVLRITNQQGRHAYIGIAFNERNDAFDFNVALNEFKNELLREQTATKMASSTPSQDFSLKSGEKIKIKLGERKKPSELKEDMSTVQHSNPRSSTVVDGWAQDPWGGDPWATDPFTGSNSGTIDPWATSSHAKSDPSNLLDL